MRVAFLSGLMLAAWLPVASGQDRAALIQGPATSLLFTPHSGATALDTTHQRARPTHWERGMWIGGAIGAVGLGAFVYALCEGLSETEESCLRPGLGGALIGALGGGVVGALIGGAFPKRDTLPLPDSTATSE